jgi:hypothetical protein
MSPPEDKNASAFAKGKTLLYWKSPKAFSLLIRSTFLKEAFPNETFGRFSRKATLKPIIEDGKRGILVLFQSETESIHV